MKCLKCLPGIISRIPALFPESKVDAVHMGVLIALAITSPFLVWWIDDPRVALVICLGWAFVMPFTITRWLVRWLVRHALK